MAKIKISIPRAVGMNVSRLSMVTASPKGLPTIQISEGTVTLRGETKSLEKGYAEFTDVPAGNHPIDFDVPNFKPVADDGDPDNDTYEKQGTSSAAYRLIPMKNIRVTVNGYAAVPDKTGSNNGNDPPPNVPTG